MDDIQAETHENEAFTQEEEAVELKSPRNNGPDKLNLSAELLDKYNALKNIEYEAPKEGPLHVFGVMNLVQKSIGTGCLITPRLYVPREIWLMDRVRIAGIEHKIRLLEMLAKEIRVLEALPPPTTEATKTVFEHNLQNVVQFVMEQRNDILKPFPNLVQDQTPTIVEPTKIERDIVNAVGGGAIGKMTSLAFGFGRMVKKQTLAVVERANSAMVETISKETLGRYSQWIESLFGQIQFLGIWLDASFPVQGTLDLQRHKAISKALKGTTWLDSVVVIATFFEEIVCELILRDVDVLLLCYMRRISQGFGAFSVDAKALIKQTLSSSIPTATT
ncbi:hypothetical protein THRCLA_06906 [Thraustotheca clavata]|uniref:Uncharacterized protein n=1 Tax=Thraustotheca clavata TaxID=74557 RepID=A0A1V9ZHV8_9STRA|nr:hypothetical protein THRCLA_06906 [Thraustotheca clavata]